MSDRKHLSATQIEMFAKCPESWRRRYIEGEVIPPRLAMLKGGAVHVAAETNMRQKIETHQDLPESEIVDAAAAAYESKLQHDGYALSEGEGKDAIGKMKDVVVALAAGHAQHQAPLYQPVAVEERFRLELPALSHDVVGVIDLVTDKSEVVDFKTSGKSYSDSAAEESTQLTLYAAAKASDEMPEVTVKLDVLIEPSGRAKKKEVRHQVVEAKRDKTDLPIIARRIAVVSKTIDAGLFPPAAVGSWWCSESWCGYWSTCPYVNAERIAASRQVAEAIKILEEKTK